MTAAKKATPRRAPAGYTTATIPAAVAVSTTVATLFAAGTSQTQHVRTITNDSASGGVLYVKFGTGASATDFTVPLAAGQYYEFPQPLYVGTVTGTLATGTGTAHVTSY